MPLEAPRSTYRRAIRSTGPGGERTEGRRGGNPPPPPRPVPLRVKVGAIGLVAIAAFGVALFGGFIPGLHPNYAEPRTIEVHGIPYFWAEYTLPWPYPPANSTAPTLVLFHNVTFAVWVTNWYGGQGGVVRGNGTEPNGTVYPFALGGAPLGANASTLFISPDAEFGAAWSGQAFVELLVRAPPGA